MFTTTLIRQKLAMVHTVSSIWKKKLAQQFIDLLKFAYKSSSMKKLTSGLSIKLAKQRHKNHISSKSLSIATTKFSSTKWTVRVALVLQTKLHCMKN